MIIVCSNCSSRLQIDEAKSPPRPFSVRCPKCSYSVTAPVGAAVAESSAASVNSHEKAYREPPSPAPEFNLESTASEVHTTLSEAERIAQLLASIVAQKAGTGAEGLNDRAAWNRRKVLVCTPEAHRESVARQLAENGYQVYVADDTGQAVERMRENQLDVVLLDAQFDPAEQGPAFVQREVNVLRPAQRRRLFFVLLSSSLRTRDAHSAFLNNVNAIMNYNELPDLPRLLDHSLREFNDLYKDFNSALKVPAL